MSEKVVSPAAVKRKQYIVLSVAAAIVVGVGVAVVSTSENLKPVPFVEKHVATQIMSPGSQADPRDTWLATGSARLSEHDQRLGGLSTQVELLKKQLELSVVNAKASPGLLNIPGSPLGTSPNPAGPEQRFPPGEPQVLGRPPANSTKPSPSSVSLLREGSTQPQSTTPAAVTSSGMITVSMSDAAGIASGNEAPVKPSAVGVPGVVSSVGAPTGKIKTVANYVPTGDRKSVV